MAKEFFYFNEFQRIEYERNEDGTVDCLFKEKAGGVFRPLGHTDHFADFSSMCFFYDIDEKYFGKQARLTNEIMNCLDGNLNMYDSIMLCEHTPEILQAVGLENKPILFTQKHLRDGLHEKGKNPKWHGLSVFDYLNLEENMKNPAMIIDSFSDDDSVLVITDTIDNDWNPIMACIKTNGSGQYQISTIGANYLTSVYGRENFMNFFQKNMEADFILYANKEKIHNLECSCGLPLSANFSEDYEFNKIIHKSNNIVNEREIDKIIPETSFSTASILSSVDGDFAEKHDEYLASIDPKVKTVDDEEFEM